MPLILGKCADAIHEIERALEVGKCELPFDVMVVRDLPFLHLRLQWPDLLFSQGRDAAAARDASLFGKF
jgi:hypothetical protein